MGKGVIIGDRWVGGREGKVLRKRLEKVIKLVYLIINYRGIL